MKKNNENFEKMLLSNAYLKGNTEEDKLTDLGNRIIYSIISNSSILNEYEHKFEDFNFEHGSRSLAFFATREEFIKITVERSIDHNHKINGIKINLRDGETISIWNGVDEYWEEI